MASLSEDMKNKRDVRRRSSVLIIDKDLGNFGLYKSILSIEYELECVESVRTAASICRGKYYDVVIVDGDFDADNVALFFDEICENSKATGDEEPILLLLEETCNKDSILSYLSIGASGCIPKPFTKDGITTAIYEKLKERRKESVTNEILIVDKDFQLLTTMKEWLDEKYRVYMVSSGEIARNYLSHRRPDLIICDVETFNVSDEKMYDLVTQQNKRIPILFMTETPDPDTIGMCASYNPEGFLVKPVEENMLVKTLERVFLMESYVSSVEGR